MRGRIIDTIFERMSVDEDLFFLTADMGINLVERIEKAYPDRFVNVGIAEQNLISVSAGLANLGYRPFAYTISNFATARCLEQIRNDVVLHEYPITILGTSTGYDNAPLGPTHHIVDDWGLISAIPGVDIYCPSTMTYAANLVDHVLSVGRPAYVRIPQGGSDTVGTTDHLVKVAGRSGGTLLATYGSAAQACLDAAGREPELSVLIFNRLRPLEDEDLIRAISPHDRVVVVEDHFADSGLYGALCRLVVRHRLNVRVESVAPRGYTLEVGTNPEYFARRFGLDVDALVDRWSEA